MPKIINISSCCKLPRCHNFLRHMIVVVVVVVVVVCNNSGHLSFPGRAIKQVVVSVLIVVVVVVMKLIFFYLQSSLITVSRIFFSSVTLQSLDLLVTDILAGLLLLRRCQRSQQARILSEVGG